MKKKIIIAVASIGLIALGIYTAWRTHNGSTDFDTFYYAAKHIIDGVPVYTPVQNVSPYIYPPFFACMISPLAFLNMEAASFLWYILSLALFAVSIALSAKMIFGHTNIKRMWDSMLFLPKAVFLTFAGAIFLDNISLLQSNILLFFAVVTGLYYFTNKRFMIGGIFFGLAISIKLLPALFLPYFIVKRKFKMAAWCLVWIAVFTLLVPTLFLGTKGTIDSLKAWNGSMFAKSITSVPNDDMMGQMFNPVNQSITASLSRWLIKNDAAISYWKNNCYKKYPRLLANFQGPLSRSSALTISYIVEFLLVAATLIYCMRRKKLDENTALNSEFALVFIALLFLDPYLKTPHLIFIVFPAMFIASSIKGRHWKYYVFAAAAILYISLGGKLFRILGLGTISLLLLWLSVPVSKKDSLV
jgi:Protein of unknown function (DUF2029).